VNKLSAMIGRYRTFLTYCLIGGSGVLLDMTVYSLLIGLAGIGYQWANALGYLSGTMLSFVLNSRYNFRVQDRLLSRFFLFLLVALLGFATSAVALNVLIERFGFDRYLSKMATLVAVVLIQYNLNRLVSFRRID
jgi:putative flippase GtrA